MRRVEDNPSWSVEFGEQLAEQFAARMPRAAARMLATLTATEKEDLSSKELVDLLALSPAAVSNSGRLLLEMGLVERHVAPDTRRDHYRVRDDLWIHLFREGFAIVDDTLALLDETLDRKDATDGRAVTRIRDMRDFYGFLSQEMPAVLDRFDAWRQQQNREA